MPKVNRRVAAPAHELRAAQGRRAGQPASKYHSLQSTVNYSTMENVERAYLVRMSAFAEKQLRKLPPYIREVAIGWSDAVERSGLREVRKSPGYHDEPLRGERVGQRSVRLNRSYRLIYEEEPGENIITVLVVEVNKHDY
jgi:toxin HigB-1